jgi:hypothetical protein
VEVGPRDGTQSSILSYYQSKKLSNSEMGEKVKGKTPASLTVGRPALASSPFDIVDETHPYIILDSDSEDQASQTPQLKFQGQLLRGKAVSRQLNFL